MKKVNLENATSFVQILMRTKTGRYFNLLLIGELHGFTNSCDSPKLNVVEFIRQKLETGNTFVFLEFHNSYKTRGGIEKVGVDAVRKFGYHPRVFGYDSRPEWLENNHQWFFTPDYSLVNFSGNKREYYNEIKRIFIDKFLDGDISYDEYVRSEGLYDILKSKFKTLPFSEMLLEELNELKEEFKMAKKWFGQISEVESNIVNWRDFMKKLWAKALDLEILARALAVSNAQSYNESLVLAGEKHIESIMNIFHKYSYRYNLDIEESKKTSIDCAYFKV